MKIAMLVTMTALVATVAQAAETERRVTVCMEIGADIPVGRIQAIISKPIVSKMFADIGVTVDWRHDRHDCLSGFGQGIVIKLRTSTPLDHRPGAMAVAYPYEGVHVEVFYDRIYRSVEPRSASSVLAHVLAHEITHMLQGIRRHSPTGIMKARWTPDDFSEMGWRPLPFANEDVRLIHVGLRLAHPNGSLDRHSGIR